MNLIVILLLLVVLVNCEDYCNICKDHIGCKNNGKFSSKCSKETTMIDLKATKIKDNLLEMHNTKRNMIALGKVNKFEPAARMATMEWDNELAKLAELNVKTCVMEHDKCRKTKKFRYSGQNLGWWSGTGSGQPQEVVKSLFNAWFNEHVDADMSIINNFQPTEKVVGHFTVAVADKNIRTGCALLRTVDGKWTTFFLACNYAATNMIGAPIYVKGKTASGCKSGKNSKFKGLCSSKEKIDTNVINKIYNLF